MILDFRCPLVQLVHELCYPSYPRPAFSGLWQANSGEKVASYKGTMQVGTWGFGATGPMCREMRQL